MTSAKVLVTGFGPFEGVPLNPSGLIAQALHNGQDIVGIELPVHERGQRNRFPRVVVLRDDRKSILVARMHRVVIGR